VTDDAFRTQRLALAVLTAVEAAGNEPGDIELAEFVVSTLQGPDGLGVAILCAKAALDGLGAIVDGTDRTVAGELRRVALDLMAA
jgi:hypothetical protein